MLTVWINGDFLEESAAHVGLSDGGLLHGAGVFTTMRAAGAEVVRIDQHLARLRDSCDALFIPLQHKDAALRDAAAELLSRNDLADARLRLTVTRGRATLDPLHGKVHSPACFLTAAEFVPYPAEFYERGMTVILLDEQKLNPYDVQAGHKTLDYLSRFDALKEAGRRGAGEALWFNVHNYLQCGSVANVFLVEGGKLVTPPTPAELREHLVRERCPYPRSNVLPGITRAAVVGRAAALGIGVETSAIDVERLLNADEVFLTNSIMGVMPVTRLERKAVGGGDPGEVTRALGAAI